jgi:hypothetical protein
VRPRHLKLPKLIGSMPWLSIELRMLLDSLFDGLKEAIRLHVINSDITSNHQNNLANFPFLSRF